MASFPTSVATLVNPTASDKMSAVPHDQQHSKANDEIEAIETALGANLVNMVKASQLDTDVTLAANSDAKIATQKAVKAYADSVAAGGGIPIGYLDTDPTLAADSDVKLATQKAVKAYVDNNASVTQYKTIAFTRDLSAASGSVNYTGFGFTPKFIMVSFTVAGTLLLGHGEGYVGADSCGFFTNGTDGKSSSDSTNLMYCVTSTGNVQLAALTAFIADGLTVAWTKSGSPTGTLEILITAFG